MTRRLALLALLALGCALAVAAASTGPFLEPDREVAPFGGFRRVFPTPTPTPTVSAEPFEDGGRGVSDLVRLLADLVEAAFRWVALLVAVAAVLWGLFAFARALASLVRLRLGRVSRTVEPDEYDPGEESRQDADAVLRRRVAEELRLLSADLDSQLDPREAVIACYVRMEAALADAGSPRAATETPLELLRRVLGSYDLPAADVRRLTDLFTEARFSAHPVTDEMRAAARRSLAAFSDAMAVRP